MRIKGYKFSVLDKTNIHFNSHPQASRTSWNRGEKNVGTGRGNGMLCKASP